MFKPTTKRIIILMNLLASCFVMAQENNWQAMAESIGGESVEDRSGDAISLSSNGNILAIGASSSDGINGERTGHVRIFEWNGSTWLQKGSDIDGASNYDNFGDAISFNDAGTIIAIGAKYHDGVNGGSSGHVRIYYWNGSDWIQRGSDLEGESYGDFFGSAVSLNSSGDTVAVGAPGNDNANGNGAGHIRVFNWNGAAWVQQGNTIIGVDEDNGFGDALSLSGDGLRIVAGAPEAIPTVDWVDDDGYIFYDYRGHARVFEWNGTVSTWEQLGSNLEGEGEDDEFGSAVDINSDGSIIAIGSSRNQGVNGSYSGHVRLFAYNGTNWIQMGQDIDGDGSSDSSGEALSLSATGHRVAIGARYNDSKVRSAGQVRVFDWNGTAWGLVGRDMRGDDEDYYNGTAISLSSDGSRVAMSQPGSNEHGYETGSTRVYQLLQSNEAPVIVAPTETTIVYPESIQEEVANVDAHNNDGGGLDSGLTYSFLPTNDYEKFSIHPSTGEINFKDIPDYENPHDVDEDNIYHISVLVDDTGSFNNSVTLDLVINIQNGQEYISQQTGMEIVGETENDQAGTHVSFNADGTVVVIGSPYNSRTPYTFMDYEGFEVTSYYYRGQVRVFKKNSETSNWEQLGSSIMGENENDRFGTAVSINADGTVIALGSPNHEGVNGTYSGDVRIFKWNGSDWTQLGNNLYGEAASDQFGSSVSLTSDGTSVAIGAPYSNGNGSSSGAVKIFNWNGTNWTQVGNNINGESSSDNSGKSVAINADGTIVAIGAPNNDGVNGSYSGHVRIYAWNGSQWLQRGADLDGESGSDNFGESLSLSADGTRLAIGAPDNDEIASRAGHVRVFEWNGASWEQMASDIDGEASYDNSGSSVSLNAAGNRLVIGARNNDGNGSNSGHVRIYDWNGAYWIRIGTDIDGLANYENFGSSVSLAGDGNWVAVGAPYNDSNGNDSGHVRIFELVPQNAPVFTAPTDKNLEIFENQTNGLLVDINANDGDGGASDVDISYSLALGNDNDFFAIDSETGEITFEEALDYEVPQDSNNDNIYELQVTADDGMPANNTTALTISVKVLEVDDTAPTGYSVSIDQSEINESNQQAFSFTYTGAELETTYAYAITSSEGGPTINGSGTVTKSSGNINAIDVSNLKDGVLTLSYFLTDKANNEGQNASATVNKSADTDNDGVYNSSDNCPNESNPDQLDTDQDTIGDVCDTDDDNDGTPDVEDAFPVDENEDTDTDGDGTGDNADADDDGDGTPDAEDAFPLDANEDVDTDGDGTGDNADADDDGDGTPDSEDAFTLDDKEDIDTDGDGTGDNADTDDDGDGFTDEEEVAAGSDPLDFSIKPIESEEPSDEETEKKLVPAEAFTPNGDGMNDAWVVPGIENYPNNTVRVYNRYGHEVYAQMSYRNDWQGFHKQKREKLPSGSYLYVIDLGNGESPLQGWIFINY